MEPEVPEGVCCPQLGSREQSMLAIFLWIKIQKLKICLHLFSLYYKRIELEIFHSQWFGFIVLLFCFETNSIVKKCFTEISLTHCHLLQS